jgi:hypothetical protein
MRKRKFEIKFKSLCVNGDLGFVYVIIQRGRRKATTNSVNLDISKELKGLGHVWKYG